MKSSLLLFFTAFSVLTVSPTLVFFANVQQRADITGGAAWIFKNPENPEVRSRADNSEKAGSSRAATDQAVEDAIVLGNAARDRRPPDFESAERAYRLAWKLDPEDPRPHVGLGNIYWDQRRYTEAARKYKDAINLMTPKPDPVRVSRTRPVRRRPKSPADRPYHPRPAPLLVQSRVYLASALLSNHAPMAAEP